MKEIIIFALSLDYMVYENYTENMDDVNFVYLNNDAAVARFKSEMESIGFSVAGIDGPGFWEYWDSEDAWDSNGDPVAADYLNEELAYE